ncbi:MAG: hypothetical protein JNL08_10840 [Planctomycetes bacterium]|nr:hypothetical protein [Planctomycetota bacterium]
MQLTLYAHPFDLDALAGHGGLGRLRDLGFGEIALATAYHAGRWLMPWHPDGRVRFLEDGTVHFRPGPDYGTLRPQPSALVDAARPSPLERLCEAAPRHGLAVRAWTVGAHNSRLGRQHPELCVENACGDRYHYALCPAQPPVQEYLRALVEDLAAHEGLGAIEFEAFGWLGWKHSSHHDKSSFTPRGVLDYALSLCFCAACCDRLRSEDDRCDPAAIRRWAQEQIRRGVTDADAMAPPKPADAAAEAAGYGPAFAARRATMAQLGRTLRQAMPPALQCAVQVHPDDLFTGSQLPIAQTHGFRADEFVVTAYGEGRDGVRALLAGTAAAAIAAPPRSWRLCLWPKAPQWTRDDDLREVRELAAAHGVTSIAIYHLGLLPWRTLERAARALAE